MYDKKFTTLLVILIIITGWTLSQTFLISQNMEMVKEKVSEVGKQLDEAVWNALPETKEEEK
jgi:regulator of protease activity HflC (stomatin/prohibitin superfamily)